jgi:hypothetical protein
MNIFKLILLSYCLAAMFTNTHVNCASPLADKNSLSLDNKVKHKYFFVS